MAQTVKNPPAMQETWVGSLGWEKSPGEENGNPFQYPFNFFFTPVFLPGESHEQRSLEGYSPWGHKQSDTTERLST